MSKDLVLAGKQINELVEAMPEHKEMLGIINEAMPEIHRGHSFFGKRQSQFMDNIMTLSKPTDIRNLRQINAEIERKKRALMETHYKHAKDKIEIKKLYKKLKEENDPIEKELIDIKINEKKSIIQSDEIYISGAIRKITNYIQNYMMIIDKIKEEQKIDNFNEIDFEREEEKYHIMTAFSQALTAARSHNGIIDEGNLIYFHQIGIGGFHAQKLLTNYLKCEHNLFNNIIKEGKDIDSSIFYKEEMKFLNDMAKKFKGCSECAANMRGLKLLNENAALKKGDTRLLENKGE